MDEVGKLRAVMRFSDRLWEAFIHCMVGVVGQITQTFSSLAWLEYVQVPVCLHARKRRPRKIEEPLLYWERNCERWEILDILASIQSSKVPGT